MSFKVLHVTVFQVKKKIKDPVDFLEKDMNKLQVDLQRTGKIMSSMQNAVDKLRFQGRKPPTSDKPEDLSLVRRPEVHSADVDDGCVFSGTASGTSANVKVKCTNNNVSNIIAKYNNFLLTAGSHPHLHVFDLSQFSMLPCTKDTHSIYFLFLTTLKR